MSFKSFAVGWLPDGSAILSDQQPLVFSGRHGLIARFLVETGKRAEAPWRLCVGELHTLAVPALQVGERMIVFEQADDKSLELLELEAIHGISTERTEMMFRFRPLRVVSTTAQLRVRHAAGGTIYTEELTLDGGVDALDGTWHWRKPHLAIGGVVCGPSGKSSTDFAQ